MIGVTFLYKYSIFIDGNIRPYIIADLYSRYLRMQDKNVLMPIGFNTLSQKSFALSKKCCIADFAAKTACLLCRLN